MNETELKDEQRIAVLGVCLVNHGLAVHSPVPVRKTDFRQADGDQPVDFGSSLGAQRSCPRAVFVLTQKSYDIFRRIESSIGQLHSGLIIHAGACPETCKLRAVFAGAGRVCFRVLGCQKLAEMTLSDVCVPLQAG